MKENIPEMIMMRSYIENSDAGIGTIYYTYSCIPELSKRIKTIIYNIDFDYISFNKMKVKIKYQNIIPVDAKGKIYSAKESWKTEYYLDKRMQTNLPFLSMFIHESPDYSIEKIDIYSTISECELRDEMNNSLDVIKDINKIIFHPDSYYRMFDFPESTNEKYRLFAGHNILFFSPPDDKIYNLEFTLTDYHPNIDNNELISEIPLLFCTGSVEVKNYNLHFDNNSKSEIYFYKSLESDRPFDRYIPGYHHPQMERWHINDSKNEILFIRSLVGKVYKGIQTNKLQTNSFAYEDIQLICFKNKLELKKGLNISQATINSPIPSAFYELLKKNENVLIPPVTEYFLYNNDSSDCDIKISSQIFNFSSPQIDNIVVKSREFKTLSFIPNFDTDKINSILSPTNFTALSQIFNRTDNKIIHEQSEIVTLLPYDTWIRKMIDESTGKTQTYFKYLTNWIRRFKSKKLNSITRNIIDMVYDKKIFGYSNDLFKKALREKKIKNREEYIREIIKAVYNSLAKQKPRYMNETLDFGRSSSQFGQRIKYPEETLEQGRGNCIDLSILFAFLIESVGLNPIIVIDQQHGHAFVGWETWNGSNKYEYLESTLVGYDSFEHAVSIGTQEEMEVQMLDYNKAYYIDIKKCREDGIFSNK
ncbi:MAG: hypothetical protein WCZ90_04350 [Melioribacteraceae bacterium]